jgi:prolyl-tRNA editing enzyme YbaK/EbsC (Cys-tRNA(Pro) deacylase)
VVSPSVAAVQLALLAAGAAGEPRSFADPVPTAAAAAAALGCQVGAIANSLVFDVEGTPLLVVASGAHRVDTEHLARTLEVGRIRRATAEFVTRHTGQQVGGVAPVGHPTPLRTVVDVALGAHPVVWAGAGDELSMFPTSFDELVRLTGGLPSTVR